MKIVVIGCFVSLVLIAGPLSVSGADTGDSLQRALYQRYQPSRIEIANPATRGTVSRYGQVLVLSVEGVPAKPFHVTQANLKSPAFHVMDFAQIDVSIDGSVHASDAGPLTLEKGTRLVVLDVKLKGYRVHLLTHTAGPVPGSPAGKPIYGCTEFVFDFEPDVVKSGRAEVVVGRIERWLEWTPGQRVCAPGIDQLCLEP